MNDPIPTSYHIDVSSKFWFANDLLVDEERGKIRSKLHENILTNIGSCFKIAFGILLPTSIEQLCGKILIPLIRRLIRIY